MWHQLEAEQFQVTSRQDSRFHHFLKIYFTENRKWRTKCVIVGLHLSLSRAWSLTAEQFGTVQSRPWLLPGQIPIRWNFLVEINNRFLVHFSSRETRQNANPRLGLSTVFAFFAFVCFRGTSVTPTCRMFRRKVMEGFFFCFEPQWKRLVLFYTLGAKRSALIWLRLELY